MAFSKKIFLILSLFLIQIKGAFAASNGIAYLFGSLGDGFLEIYNSEQATYFFLIAGLFWALFALIHSGMQKVSHLSGKPAKVISFVVTFMGVTLLVFGKSASDVIELFKGSVGLFFSILFGGIIIASSIWISKKFKDKVQKILFISTGIYIGTSFILPIFDNFFNLVGSNLVDGAAANLGSILNMINSGAGLVAFVTLIMILFQLLSGGANIYNKSKYGSNKGKIKNLLKKINKEFDEFQKEIQIRNNAIKSLSGFSQNSKTSTNGIETPISDPINESKKRVSFNEKFKSRDSILSRIKK